MKLVILITAQMEDGVDVAQAWHDGGAPGITLVRSHGLHSLRQAVEHGDVELPRVLVSMSAAMAGMIDSMEENSLILLSLVDDAMADRLVTLATERLGDLTAPDAGVIFVVPVERALGLHDHRRR